MHINVLKVWEDVDISPPGDITASLSIFMLPVREKVVFQMW
jgi:hypothetical protein